MQHIKTGCDNVHYNHLAKDRVHYVCVLDSYILQRYMQFQQQILQFQNICVKNMHTLVNI